MTTKVCVKCNVDFAEQEFQVTKRYKGTVYRHSTCRECERGHVRGFAGKINDDEKKALLAVDWNKALVDIRDECKLQMGLQAWYRYNRTGAVKTWLEKSIKPPEP
jgi:hypothetical protein